MSNRFESILETVGRTPVVRINRLAPAGVDLYVKVEAYDGELDQSTGEALVAAIADALPGEADLPPEFASLPTDGMVAGSIQYTRKGLFSLSELEECVHAEYATVDAWNKLASKWQETDLEGDPVRFREVPYSGLVGVIRSNDLVLGVTGAADEAQLLDRLRAISDR